MFIKRILFFLITFILFFQITALYAQTAFYAKATPQGDAYIQLQLVIENGEPSDINPPKLDGLKIVQGPTNQQSVNVINGAMTKSYSQVYTLQPTRNGKLKIGEATATISGIKYTTKPIEVTASGTKQTQSNSAITNAESIDEINNQTIFVKATLSQNTAYVGEQVVLTYKVYTRLTVSGFQLQKLLPTSGCWENNIQLPNDNVTKETLNGKEYNCLIIKKSILIPQVSGEISINEIELLANVKVRVSQARNANSAFANDPFFQGVLDDFFSYQTVPTTLKSEVVKLNVKPLPVQNKPTNFKGAVGQLDIKWLNTIAYPKADEPFETKIIVSGTGNLNFIEPPILSLTDGLETYDAKEVDQFNQGSEKLSGTRTFNYTIVPKRAGLDSITGVEFSYFDNVENMYKSIALPPLVFKSTTNQSDNSKIRTTNAIQDITESFSPTTFNFFGSTLYYALLIVPCLLLFLQLYKTKQLNLRHANPAYYASQSATNQAQMRLQKANEYLKLNNNTAFYKAQRSAILQWVSEKYNLPMGELSKDKIEHTLISNQIDTKKSNELLEILDNCELALYAPGSKEDMKVSYNKLSAWFENIT